MLLKKIRPSRWISFLAITWGITMTCMGLVNNFGQLVALRVLLGMLEAGSSLCLLRSPALAPEKY